MRCSIFAVVILTAVSALPAADQLWENPVFETEKEARAAARVLSGTGAQQSDPAVRLFLDSVVGAENEAGYRLEEQTRFLTIDRILLSHPRRFLEIEAQRQTVERFTNEMPRQQTVVEERLARFGYPTTPGLVYCRLVDNVDAFAGLSSRSSDKMSQVGGVTYYCRYIVLPLSYVGERGIRELRQSAALNPNLDVDSTLRRWQGQSYASLVSTFRHELVHAHTNSSLDVPEYSDRTRFPTWFHEGTATYLSGDPQAGLSDRYQQYQNLFFYLVQRHGVPHLQVFFSTVIGGVGVGSALSEVYGIESSEQLFSASGRWHRWWEIMTTVFWIWMLLTTVIALRGSRLPVIASLQIVIGIGLGLATAGGLAEHLWGLNGPTVVLVSKTILACVAIAITVLGWTRVWSYSHQQ